MHDSALLDSCATLGRLCELAAQPGTTGPDEGCPCTR